jgi:hypothetical protein
MATGAVPAQVPRDPIVGAWWFRFLVRAAFALLAFWLLSIGADRYTLYARPSALSFQARYWLWWSWLGATVAAGLLFGSATWLPFAKVRFLPSRLLLTSAALLPVAHFWWVYARFGTVVYYGTGRVLTHRYWFDGESIQFVMAVVAGVAIASCLRIKESRPAPG